MPKARYLAPWHQEDLLNIWKQMEAEGGSHPEGRNLDVQALGDLKGKPAIYHCISRVVDRRFVFGDEEKEQFVAYMRAYERFCQVRVLAFCVMSNHFHILLEVPAAPEGRGRDWSDAKLLDHLSGLYSVHQLAEIRWRLEHYRAQGNNQGAEALRDSYFRRMWDLSEFMKTLKQRFGRWFNGVHGRRGTLWEERFKSVLVEDGHAARVVAAYIDLNPVRAGMVADPRDYRWCSYGEAMGGKQRAREGLQRVMFEKASSLPSNARAEEVLANWTQAARHYREILGVDRRRETEGTQGTKQVRAEVEAIHTRVRHFIDGLVLGSEDFVNQAFQLTRDRFGKKRRNGARQIRGLQSSLQSMRDLQSN